MPKDFRLTIGTFGGITGLWEGFTIQNDFKVYHWKGNFKNENSKLIAEFNSEIILKIIEMAKEKNFIGMTKEKPGNLSRLLEFDLNGEKSIAIWEYPSFNNKSDIDDFFEYVMELIEKSKTKN